jgi:hypothetical protein
MLHVGVVPVVDLDGQELERRSMLVMERPLTAVQRGSASGMRRRPRHLDAHQIHSPRA